MVIKKRDISKSFLFFYVFFYIFINIFFFFKKKKSLIFNLYIKNLLINFGFLILTLCFILYYILIIK